ncbi:MAG: prolyl oligopeptidase family serine peptidase [Reyranella sp.]|nr:prolyl oligopeptidase family serine peptidase [Reyranella sp.]
MKSLIKSLVVGLFAWIVSSPGGAQSVGPQDEERNVDREQVWRIPAAGGAPLMLATVMRPRGEARSPLVVINHGSPADNSVRPRMDRPRYSILSSWFVSRGYVVVLPMRRGYGATGGTWAENYGSCENPDYAGAGLQTASDIKAAIDYMRAQPFVKADRTIVVGQSAGGWGTVALSSLNPSGVSGMINFAGGRGGHQKLKGGGVGNCASNALISAAARYGATARVPMLWIYAANDSFFEPNLVRRMAEAYNGAGGRATYQAVGPNGNDGHNLASSSKGSSVWSPLVEGFLSGL